MLKDAILPPKRITARSLSILTQLTFTLYISAAVSCVSLYRNWTKNVANTNFHFLSQLSYCPSCTHFDQTLSRYRTWRSALCSSKALQQFGTVLPSARHNQPVPLLYTLFRHSVAVTQPQPACSTTVHTTSRKSENSSDAATMWKTDRRTERYTDRRKETVQSYFLKNAWHRLANAEAKLPRCEAKRVTPLGQLKSTKIVRRSSGTLWGFAGLLQQLLAICCHSLVHVHSREQGDA